MTTALYLTCEQEPLAWQSEHHAKPPKRCKKVDDALSAEAALRLVRGGTSLLWTGDFINAKQLLAAMARKIDKQKQKIANDPKTQFNLYRLAQAQKAQLLGLLLIRIEKDYRINLKRAPNIREAAEQVWAWQEPFVISLRELLGLMGAHQWYKKGVFISALGASIYPFYGVFSPVRGEYIELLHDVPLPAVAETAFDIGCGTGVLSVLLAKKGVKKIVATDTSERAVACSHFNIEKLGLASQITLLQQDFFPSGQADIIVCNPPWIPAKASTSLEAAVYDPESSMLKGFLNGLADHLTAQGQGWLILSDLAEHLGLRTREQLLGWIKQAGLYCVEKYDTRARHKKVFDTNNAFHQARQKEVTSLWVLKKP